MVIKVIDELKLQIEAILSMVQYLERVITFFFSWLTRH